MEKIIIFDFDGVIANSIRECFLAAWWAYQNVEEPTAEMFGQEYGEAESLFYQYRYLVGPAHEYYFLLKSVCTQLEGTNDTVPNTFNEHKHLHKEEARGFSKSFFRIRHIARNKFYKQWITLNPLYPGMAEILSKCLGKRLLFIASTKDEASIDSILRENGLEIPGECILGKDFNIDKRQQLQGVMRRTNAASHEIAFIDDNPEYLAQVQSLGVRLFLATWGYNSPEGWKEASRLGARLLTISELKEMVT